MGLLQYQLMFTRYGILSQTHGTVPGSRLGSCSAKQPGECLLLIPPMAQGRLCARAACARKE